MFRPMLLVLAVLVAAPAAAQTVVPIEDTLHRVIAAGQEAVIRNYGSWNSSTCAPNPPPQVVLHSQPQHGTVTIRPGMSTIRLVREGKSKACLGVTIPGTVVAYTPSPTFRGTDGFDYTITSVNGVYHDTVVLDVR
jgi:hypothetical protein